MRGLDEADRCLQSAAQPVHQEPYGHVMVSAELVGGLVVHLLGESRQGCVSDVIHPGPAKPSLTSWPPATPSAPVHTSARPSKPGRAAHRAREVSRELN